MADVYLWATINQVAAARFVVLVSVVSSRGAPEQRADVRQGLAHSMEDAERMRAKLMLEAGHEARARGDRVIDVVDD